MKQYNYYGEKMSDYEQRRERYKVKPIEMPDDELFYERPFFDYGLFKEGQLAHYKIRDLIKKVEHSDVPLKLRIKDGVPLVVNKENKYYRAVGDKICFRDECKEEAYERISNTLPGNIFKWDIISIDGKEFNLLVGKDTKGSFEYVDDNFQYNDTYDGRNDPFFRNVVKFIESEMKEFDYDDEYAFFKLQMYYMLLWSAIERYAVLKYNVSESQAGYLKELSEDDLFAEALAEVKPEKLGTVYSAKNGTPLFYTRNPFFKINVYYTLRSNVAHRGKEPENNMDSLEKSLCDLLKIFDYIIKNTFDDDES